ncbi:MAG: hypothetical protein HGA19_22610 [Oscillochloris sp.]|nr:hypothetical protein [Oscillochloris sp.]
MISYKITATATTRAPPERIFAVLDDFGRWPKWMPSFERVKVELPANSRPRLGYHFRLRGSVVYADMQVVEFTPFSRSTNFRISFPPFTGVNRCVVRPLGEGRYRIERVDSLHIPEMVAKVINATQRERFSRLAQEFIVALIHEVGVES